MENQETAIREEREFLSEAPATNSTGSGGLAGAGNAGFSANATAPVAGFDPVLISLIRRSMPNLVAYDLAGVQPMTGPTGLIFAMRSKFTKMDGTEALFNEADTAFSAVSAGRTDGDIGSGYVAGSDGASVGFGTTSQDAGTAESNNQDYLTHQLLLDNLSITLVRVWIPRTLKH